MVKLRKIQCQVGHVPHFPLRRPKFTAGFEWTAANSQDKTPLLS
jgi:hypothetical protein